MDGNLKKLILKDFKKIGVVETGDFILRGGEHSPFYLDIKKAYGYPGAVSLLREALWAEMGNEEITCVASSGHGGIPLGVAISEKYQIMHTMVRKSPKSYGRNTLLDGYLPNKDDRIAIVDDVLTKGGTIEGMVESLRYTGAAIQGAYVVVKRGESSLSVPVRYLFDIKEILEPFGVFLPQ